MTYRLVPAPGRLNTTYSHRLTTSPDFSIDSLFDGNLFALDTAIYARGDTPRHWFLIERTDDEEPGMPRRGRRP